MIGNTNEPVDPADPRDAVGDLLGVLAVAAGIAGCLMWEVGAAFYFVPLGLAAFALVCLVGALTIANRVNVAIAGLAVLALVGSGAIGIDKKTKLDDLSEPIERPFSNTGQYP